MESRALLCRILLSAALAAAFASAAISGQSLEEFQIQSLTLLQSGDLPGAYETAERGLSGDPDDPVLGILAAVLEIQFGRLEQADSRLERLRRLYPSDPSLHAWSARVKLRKGDASVAEELLNRALLRFPDDAELHHLRGAALFQQGRDLEALDSARKAVERSPADWNNRRLLSLLLGIGGMSEEADVHLREAFRADPQRPQTLLWMADRAMADGRITDAEELLSAAASRDPENPLFHRKLAGVLMMQGLEKEAGQAAAVADRLEKAFHLYIDALTAVREGRQARAIALLEEAVQGNSEFSTGTLYLARLLQRMGETERALRLYEEMLEREVDSPSPRNSAAFIRASRGEPSAVLFSETDDPQDLNRLLIEAYDDMLNEDWDAALGRYLQASRQAPLEAGILLHLSWCLEAVGRHEEALAALRRAAAIEPSNPMIEIRSREIILDVASSQEANGDWEAALVQYEALLSDRPADGSVRLRRAYALQQLRRLPEAVEEYQRGLGLEPEQDWARLNLASTLLLLSRLDEAASQFEALAQRTGRIEYVYHLGMTRLRQRKTDEGWILLRKASDAGFAPARRFLQASERRSNPPR
jgi:tetratricopeptide (TPR) repeat protein